ncbi:MAG: YncE family protein [Nitrospiria bacterium]
MMKRWLWTCLGVSLFSLCGISGPYADPLVTGHAGEERGWSFQPDRTVRPLKGPSPLPMQGPSFQPILLAFDRTEGRLFVATPEEGSTGSRLLLFRHPEKDKVPPDPLFQLPGVSSGLLYDPQAKTLFMANATKHEILMFDRFDPNRTKRPTRVLRRFNFPTGIGTDPSSGRLFIADAHPGAILVFERMNEVQGSEPPTRTMGGETGLNGPFALATDPIRGRLYVSNFDGVFVFNLKDLSAQPERLPLPRNTLARGLAFDRSSRRLYIAVPMRRSYYIYDGETLEQVRLEGVRGPFPFSLAIDSKNDRLYLAGTDPKVGVIHRAGGGRLPKQGPGEMRRTIDRWLRWKGPTPPPLDHPKPPQEEGPNMIHFPN